MILAETFDHSIFRQSLARMFATGPDGHLEQGYNATLEVALPNVSRLSELLPKLHSSRCSLALPQTAVTQYNVAVCSCCCCCCCRGTCGASHVWFGMMYPLLCADVPSHHAAAFQPRLPQIAMCVQLQAFADVPLTCSVWNCRMWWWRGPSGLSVA